MQETQFRLPFGRGAAFELFLLLLAAGLAAALAVPLWGGWRWTWRDFGLGLSGSGPMLLAFAWLMRTEIPTLRRIREFVRGNLCPALGEWNMAQLLAISVLAGLSEETLFRAVVQGRLEEAWGFVPALLLASALFGACHWITPAYALVATLMGLYLGGLWWWSGNLLVPVVAHATYDFAALLWLLRIRPSRPAPPA